MDSFSLQLNQHVYPSSFIGLPNSTSALDQDDTPTLANPTTLPQQHQLQSMSWPASLASSSASSPSSCSSFSSHSDSSLSSPSSSPPLCHHHHPLAPVIPRVSGSSSSAVSLSTQPTPIIARTSKLTQPLFLLPGPALSHLRLAPNTLPTKVLNPPPNFATVAPGVFRSSFPKPENFEFIAKLRLKTVLTLVQEPYPIELVRHYERVGIKLIQYPIPGNKVS